MKPRPTVLHVLEAAAGGTERHLIDLIRHVDAADHAIVVPSTHLEQSTDAVMRRALDAGAMVERIEMRRTPAPIRNLAALRALRRLIHRLDPDLVHGHSSVGGAFARLAAAGTGKPVVYTPNGIARVRYGIALERMLARLTDRLIAVSESEGAFALEHRLVDPERLVVIPNGIELGPLPPRSPSLREGLRVPREVPLVGSLGRLTWQKAPEVYAAACALVAAKLPEPHFLLIGSGPQESGVRQALGAVGDRFHHLTALSDAAAAFGELDVYVLASRFEGGPYTVLEAMRAGVPVVATAADGTRDAVDHERTGLLVPVDDPERLAEAIISLLLDPPRRQQLATAARRRLSERFDVKVMAAATTAAYHDLFGARSASDAPAHGRDPLPSLRDRQ